ncbi:MAG: hypothetical protein USCAAHI_02414 [Beijerinckiaceae bacterium]|nr:MAG: hypothetical protein USCAAHI_02414 [Beijerinckiaceae bacterium]
MIEGWRKSLEKAKQEAAKGDLDAAKDVEALTLWIHGVMSGSLACSSRIARRIFSSTGDSIPVKRVTYFLSAHCAMEQVYHLIRCQAMNSPRLGNTAAAFFPDGTALSAHSNANVQGSIRGKVGIALGGIFPGWDRVLIYATGGVAFGGFNTNVSIANSGALNGGFPFFASGNVSSTHVGWTVGGGVQYAVTNNWSIFAEYRYSNWGSIRENNFGLLPAGAFFSGNRQINQNQVQVGFDYKFDLWAPAPVVAKY